MSFWTKVLFRKYGYNFYEILIVLFYVMGIGTLIYAFFGIIEGVSGLKVSDFATFIGIIYSAWAIGRFFNKSRKTKYLKAFVAYFIGLLSFGIFIIGLGFFIDLGLK